MIFQRLKELNLAIEECEYCQKVALEDKLKSFKAYSQVLLEPMQGLSLFVSFLQKASRSGGKIIVIGNGGSAGIASHFATDLLKTIGLPALTLFDSNMMTCLSNDYGYEEVFSSQLKKILKPEDVLVAISSSGNSLNILNAAQTALEKKAALITLSGFKKDNHLRKTGDLNIWLNKEDYGLVESGHFFILHTIVDLCKAGYFTPKKEEQLVYTK